MPSHYQALAEDSESEADEDLDANRFDDIPSYEDLSTTRYDEETVLQAIYGEDYSKTVGVWGSSVLNIRVRPPDIPADQIGSRVTLSLTLGKRYPYVAPSVHLKSIEGLTLNQQKILLGKLSLRCKDLASIGSVMVCELVQMTEDFLYENNDSQANMSAWEKMNARKELEKKQAIEQEQKLESYMYDTEERSDSIVGFNLRSKHASSIDQDIEVDSAANARIQKELQRQIDAISICPQNTSKEKNNKDYIIPDFDDYDDDDDYQFQKPSDDKVSSRYKSDFIELSFLGQGGQGTVVKVRNRLDRRIYAIKKVVLESERGRNKEFARLENMKLRREVTHISRMTHKNIVRYYQAWVEGGETQNMSPSMSTMVEEDIDENSSDGKVSDNVSDVGFWGKRPLSKLTANGHSDSEFSSEDISNPWSIDDTQYDGNRFTDEDLLNFQADYPLTPLLNVIGCNSGDMRKQNRKSSVATSEDSDDIQLIDKGIKKLHRPIMYIQMEYCENTMRHLIDDQSLQQNDNDRWKMIRQILEALSYIHRRKIIHRDLKPGNIFLDSERNIRLGDFGLATTRIGNNDNIALESIDDITDLLGGSIENMKSKSDDYNISITGGVGTTFYIAPEQEIQRAKRNQTDYDCKADIFSLGIIIFEMFHRPFATQMERASTLQKLRGDVIHKLPLSSASSTNISVASMSSIHGSDNNLQDEWLEIEGHRFPESFTASDNCKKIILWCLRRDPKERPHADELLKSDLLPRQIELDQHYLQEALQSIANPDSESHQRIVQALFDRHARQHVEITWDTDASIKAQKYSVNISSDNLGKRIVHNPNEILGKSLSEIGGFNSNINISHLIPMNSLATLASTSSLRRAKGAGKLSKGEVLRTAMHHAAASLAINSAASAAATGNTDGVLGSDPRVVQALCNQIMTIFHSHGAICLKSPLLRPKLPLDLYTAGLAEVINERSINLILPEDLQVNFARAIGRGGAALSNTKRYQIDNVYYKSATGGHPREALEASFDIIIDDPSAQSEYFVAETIMVVSQVLHILSDTTNHTEMKRPYWILRLSHTRLADSILDLCQVPVKEDLRRFCFGIFSLCSAPVPHNFGNVSSVIPHNKEEAVQADPLNQVIEMLEKARQEYSLPVEAANLLKIFLTCSCLPLSIDSHKALDALQEAAKKIRLLDEENVVSSRRHKKFEEIGRSIRAIRNCIDAMSVLGIKSLYIPSDKVQGRKVHQPLCITIDLGLRQKHRHYHGNIIFQAILLPEDFQSIKSNDILIGSGGKGIKVAEGGRYDDLVRRFRPPGNLLSAQYASAPIPICTGVRFFIGRIVEQLYLNASLECQRSQESIVNQTLDVDILRKSLAHPFPKNNMLVTCLVASTNGFDSSTLPERIKVASTLWASGISAEYVPHSGVMSTILKQRDPSTEGYISECSLWTLDQICALCSILKIPFVIVVQHHLLQEKGCIRLRTILDNYQVQNGWQEVVIPLSSLASEIQDRCFRLSGEVTKEIPTQSVTEKPISSRDISNASGRAYSVPSDFECIYIDSDQFYLDLEHASGKDPKMKSVLKVMKTSRQNAESYVSNILVDTPVLVAPIPFRIVREFNTEAMFGNGPTVSSSTSSMMVTHSSHKKVLKSLASCLDHLLRRFEAEPPKKYKSCSKGSIFSFLVYSIPDDRFDLLTLSKTMAETKQDHMIGHISSSSRRPTSSSRGAKGSRR